MPTVSALRRRGFPPEGVRNFLDAGRRGGQGPERGRDRDARVRGQRRAEPRGRSPLRRPAPAQGRDRELPRGAGRGDGRRQQPRGRVGRNAQGAVLARALDRARRLHGGPAEQVLPPRPGPRGTPALRLFRHLHRRREGRGRRGRRAALHLRPGDARRRRARRAPAEGDAALAVGRPCLSRPRSVSTTACSPVPTPVPTATSSPTSTPTRRRCSPVASSSLRSPRCRSARPSSSSVSATSARTSTRRSDRLVFNRTLGLKDTWAKLQK